MVARADGLAGESSAYVDEEGLLAFADDLAAYPLPDTPIRTVRGGLGGGTELRSMVELSATPVGRHGQVGIFVHLATFVWPDDLVRTPRAVDLVLLTTYERLGAFSRDLRRTVRGDLDHATIEGERLIR